MFLYSIQRVLNFFNYRKISLITGKNTIFAVRKNAIKKLLKTKLKKIKSSNFKNPYYCKDSSKKILNFIENINYKKFKLLNKKYN